jgi:3-oxoacyl-[acyl-carrier protein] reductase
VKLRGDSMGADLAGRTAIVTGASRGIGRAIAIGLAARGAAVVVGYIRNEAKAEEVVKEIGGQGGAAIAVQGDLSRPAEVTRLFDRAEKEFGVLDIVVANAADVVIKPVVDCTEKDYDRIFAANTKSAFFTLQEAARRVRDGGSIIATCTGGTRCSSPAIRDAGSRARTSVPAGASSSAH